MDRDQLFMNQALELALSSAGQGGFPNGAVVVLDGSVIGEGISVSRINPDPTAHAEVWAIRDAALKMGIIRLAGATLYTALEPCLMCLHSASWAGISRIVYGAGRENFNQRYYEGQGSLSEAVRNLERQIVIELLPGFTGRIISLVESWEK